MKKMVDTSWDFRGEDTKQYTHCFHRYPAQMIPQIARRIIEKYGKPGKTLLDPYCGSGTSLVEGVLFGMDAIGCDINPLAVTMSRAKTNKMSLKKLSDEIAQFETLFLPFSIEQTERKTKPTIPRITNIDYWFPPSSVRCLGILRTLIDKINDSKVRDFFTVAFSETVRESSYTRSGEFKLFRIPQEKLGSFKPRVYETFLDKVRRNYNGYKLFNSARKKNNAFVYICDTTKKIPAKAKNIQLVVTSPPYGDSRTTVAYGQFTTLPLEWLGYEKARQLDRNAMGGRNNGDHYVVESEYYKKIMKRIDGEDLFRGRDVMSFYIDLDKSIENVCRVVSKGGFVCYVVGNRTVKGHTIPTDEIIVELFARRGIKHIETIIRNIPNKAMPSMNSPSNVPGQLVKTMTEEYIVVMKKAI